MQLQLTKDWRIVTDELNFILQKRFIRKKDKTEYWRNKAYNSSLDVSLESFVTKHMLACDASTLKECQDTIKSLKQLITTIYKK